MSTPSTSTVARTSQAGEVVLDGRSAAGSRLADYLELTRPRIALMALLTVTVGYTLAARAAWRIEPLLHAFLGIGLVAAASSALNQVLERSTDGLMRRTAGRPLPAERLSVQEALFFGVASGVGGVGYLLLTVNPLTALLSAFTLLLYVSIYTPLKRRSGACTIVGAVAGAMPPVLGWTAAGGAIDSGALSLFAILFLWQFPHFLAIAWIYRSDYERAGLRMLPAGPAQSRTAGLIAVLYALALLPVSLLPGEAAVAETLAGGNYTLAAVVLGVGYVVFAVRFAAAETIQSARDLLWASLIYLPLLLSILTCDHFQLLQ